MGRPGDAPSFPWEPGDRVRVEGVECGAVVEEVGTNRGHPNRVLVRYDRVLVERLPMFGVQAFGSEWVLPGRLDRAGG